MAFSAPKRLGPVLLPAIIAILTLGGPPAFADTGPAGIDLLPQIQAVNTPLPDTTVPQATLDRLHLSDKDADIYARIFTASARGDTKTFNAMQKKLADQSLIDWARVRRGHAQPTLWLPQTAGTTPRQYHAPAARDKKATDAAKDIALSVSVLLRTDDIARALEVVRRASLVGTIDRIEAAQLYAQVAAAQLYAGQARDAQALSHMALRVGGTLTPDAAWIAGLSSWVLGDYNRAARYFAWVPRSAYAGGWLRSAASFWTARALMRQGDFSQVSAWLREAARNPRSFYGLIATRILGSKFDFNWTVPPLNGDHIKTLAQYPGAVRALKLAQAGQMDMARLELALLDEKAAPQWREALSALALTTLKPAAAMKLAGLLQTPNGAPIDMAIYPVSPWQPRDGYRLDPALIHAFMRQESGFKPAATNKGSGATGLLQIIPRTARAVEHGTSTDALKNPETSLSLGQKYIESLLERTGGNLFEAAMAYNAGPGNLAAWRARIAGHDDPLLFIELVPYGETRAYVEQVMANYWIYSLRMGGMQGGGVATLDAVAAGKPAVYAAYDTTAPRPANEYASVSANTAR